MCLCHACANIEKLKLKIIVHSGEAVFSKIGHFSRLSGVDVITVHRLLKNSIDADEYILMTAPAKADVDFPEKLDMVVNEEVYDIGAIKTYVCFPETGKKECTKDTAAQRFSASSVGLEILRYEIQHEYTEVANTPDKGFHFHTGSGLAKGCVQRYAPTSHRDKIRDVGHHLPGAKTLSIGRFQCKDSTICQSQNPG